MPSQRTVRRLASTLGLARAAVGVAALASPELAVGGWAGHAVDAPGGALMARAFGARDAALGLGVHLAARRGAPMKTWLRLSGACDVADAAATVAGGDQLGKQAPHIVGVAVSGAVASFALAAWAEA